MPTCPKCQTENPEDSKFCINCGSTLEVISPSETTTPTPTPQVSPEPPPKSKKPLIIGGIVAILFLAIVGLGAFVVLPKFKPQQPSVSQFPSLPREQPTPAKTEAIIKYETDTDNDGIPDFVEEVLGFNPQVSVVEECRHESCGEVSEAEQIKPTNILLILDSSGSMAQVAGAEVKMAAAKRVIKEYATKIPEGTNLGLMVYGHKGSNSTADKAVSCAGIDLLYPVGQVNVVQFNTAIDSFSPTGWTPIGSSLRKAENEAFVGKEGQNNFVIVVSDGIETCDSDPVSAARELKESGIQAQIDVIGFAVDATARAQLEQIAKIGGGKYYNVNSAQELSETFDKKKFWEVVGMSKCLVWSERGFQDCIIFKHYNKAIKYLVFDIPREEAGVAEKARKRAHDKMQSILEKSLENYYQQQQDIQEQIQE